MRGTLRPGAWGHKGGGPGLTAGAARSRIAATERSFPMPVRRLPLLLACLSIAGGCANLPSPGRAPAPAPAPVAATTAPAPVLAGPSASPAALDTVSDEQKAAARAQAAAAPAGGALGEATVALGDPADPGLWVKTALVDAEAPGTVRTGAGEAIAVTLRPLGSDGGAQISLAALRALGLPIAGLHPVTLARAR